MRILFAFAGGRGHADPLVPIARAARDAGHTVAFCGRASVVAELRARGYTTFPDPAAAVDAQTAIWPLAELDAEREQAALRVGFADRVARVRAGRVLRLAEVWAPDVVVCDEYDYGSVVAAEALGIPHASVIVTAFGALLRPEVVTEPLAAVRAAHGLPPGDPLAAVSRHLAFFPGPPGFRDPAFPLPATTVAIRPAIGGDGAWAWDPPLPGAATVHFTLGTVFNVESGDLFGRALAGLATLAVNVVATVGPQLDPARFGPQPPNVRVERYVPLSALLAHCDVVVCHGGSGTVLAAVSAGVPLVVLPMGADQAENADRCVALGVGVRLDALRATPELVASAAAEVLANPAYRAAATRLRDEAAALPDARHAVGLLERLARA